MSYFEEVIIEAATDEEALLKAEETFKVSRDKLDIEFISSGSSGFLGLGKKDVKIRVRKRMEPVSEVQELLDQEEHIAIDGSITITNGKVSVENPRGFGKYPNIIGSENVEVYVNGYNIKKTTFVTAEDKIEIVTHNIPPKAEQDIEITDDKMQAYLKIKKQKGKNFSVKDVGPALNVKVRVNIEEIEPVITVEEVYKLLTKHKVVYGIKETEILKAIDSNEDEICVEVAHGLLPEGEDQCKIIYSFLNNEQEEKPSGPYGAAQIYSVQVGEILARKYVPEIRKNGMDVTGREVPFKEKEIRIGEGVVLNKDGTVAVAAIPGRPVLEGDTKKILSVKPVYFVDGDLDAEIGNVKFNGDIYVSGNVLEGFKLDIRGRIVVRGNVSFSSLSANMNISVHNKVLSGEIQAGIIKNYYKRVYPELKNLKQRVENLYLALKQLKKQKAFSVENLGHNVDGQILQLLLDYKYQDIPLAINRFIKELKYTNKELTGEVARIIILLNEKLCNLGPLRIKNKNAIKFLLQEFENALDYIKYLSKQTANVVVGYAQNSNIRASGDITVTGEACLFSNLEAGGSIFIPNGIVRGGKLTAREKIEVLELRSLNNSQINITLLENCVFKADKVNSYVVIQRGAQKHIVDEPCRHLTASSDSEGKLIVTALPESFVHNE